ncbi:MAG: glycosyl transferase family 9 [Rhodocyclaceae bacterium]|jgi:ADP-heptose:LPS heptosyltransferase|nr:glycosyl transferase family 9 [Rhodocyclaceae bacterium]
MGQAGIDAKMKILVIRRDNIGDLVCTTPLLRALRQRFPEAWIGALVNSYNAPVLAGNPDVSEVLVYRKAKHREKGESALAVYAERARLVWRLRRMGIDDVILAAPARQSSALRFARWIAPRRVLGGRDSPLPHEAEKVFAVLENYGIAGPPPPCRIVPDPAAVARMRAQLPAAWRGRRLIGVHISARKPSQRWPAERFAALIMALHGRPGQGGSMSDAVPALGRPGGGAPAFLLFWSPGEADNPLHPGDDDKARQIARIATSCRDLPLLAMPTHRLEELIAGLSLADSVVCSDGGAMHVAAGLGKPIVCLFGQSDTGRWHPWGVPHVALQKESRDVNDITVEESVVACAMLMRKIGA